MKYLCVFSHCDDELVFGWPLALDLSLDRELLICSSDENNPQRQWCRRRREALAEVCELLKMPFRCLPHPSEFYKLPHRGKSENGVLLGDVVEDIRKAMAESDADVVFTHNPHGEYGHLDHCLVHRIVRENFDPDICSRHPKIWFTNIFEYRAGWPIGGLSSVITLRNGYRDLIRYCTMTNEKRDLFDACKATYDKYGCWTWDFPIATSCGIYSP